MYGRTSGDEPVRTRQTDDDLESEPPAPDPLEAVVAGDETRPDRLTIYPPDCPDERKLTTWLSADASAFVDLGERR